MSPPGYAEQMATRSRLSTSVLLTCAAIGVATGLLGGIAGWVTPVVLATLPILYGFVLGAHVLAALVASAMAPQWAFRSLGPAILFGGIQELVAALTRYRLWNAWRVFVSAIVIGVLVAIVVAFAAHLSTLAPWAQVVYLALAVLGPVAWTAVGLGIGTALRRAGVARGSSR